MEKVEKTSEFNHLQTDIHGRTSPGLPVFIIHILYAHKCTNVLKKQERKEF